MICLEISVRASASETIPISRSSFWHTLSWRHLQLQILGTSNSRPWRSIGSFMYVGSAGPGPGGRTDGRRVDGGRTGGRQGRCWTTVQRFSSIFTNKKTLCVSVVSHPAQAQVPIFTAQMKKVFKNIKKYIVFFDCSNHARAQVPIFIPKMKKTELTRPAQLARLSTRIFDAARDLENSRRGARMTWVLANSLKRNGRRRWHAAWRLD